MKLEKYNIMENKLKSLKLLYQIYEVNHVLSLCHVFVSQLIPWLDFKIR